MENSYGTASFCLRGRGHSCARFPDTNSLVSFKDKFKIFCSLLLLSQSGDYNFFMEHASNLAEFVQLTQPRGLRNNNTHINSL